MGFSLLHSSFSLLDSGAKRLMNLYEHFAEVDTHFQKGLSLQECLLLIACKINSFFSLKRVDIRYNKQEYSPCIKDFSVYSPPCSDKTDCFHTIEIRDSSGDYGSIICYCDSEEQKSSLDESTLLSFAAQTTIFIKKYLYTKTKSPIINGSRFKSILMEEMSILNQREQSLVLLKIKTNEPPEDAFQTLNSVVELGGVITGDTRTGEYLSFINVNRETYPETAIKIFDDIKKNVKLLMVSFNYPDDFTDEIAGEDNYEMLYDNLKEKIDEYMVRVQILNKNGLVIYNRDKKKSTLSEQNITIKKNIAVPVVLHPLPPLETGIEVPVHITPGKKNSFYVCDHAQHGVLHYSSKGKLLNKFGSEDLIPYPVDFSFDPFGAIFILSSRICKFIKLNKQGKKIYSISLKDTSPNMLFLPRQIEIDSEGLLWLLDTGGNILYRWNPVTQKKHSHSFEENLISICLGSNSEVWILSEKKCIHGLNPEDELFTKITLPDDVRSLPGRFLFYEDLFVLNNIKEEALFYDMKENRWGKIKMCDPEEHPIQFSIFNITAAGELILVEDGTSTVWMTPFPLRAYLE